MGKVFQSFCLAATVIVALYSCSKGSSSTAATTANVMYVNGCAGAGNLEALLNRTLQGSSSGINFGGNSGYIALVTGNDTLSYMLVSTQSGLDTVFSNLKADSSYSYFASGLVTGPSGVITGDDLSVPASGFAKVRFVNLCSDGLNESIYVATAQLDSNIGYLSCTPFFQISATSSANVLAQDPNMATFIATLTGQQFSSGGIYTIMLTGTKNVSSGTSALTLTVIKNK